MKTNLREVSLAAAFLLVASILSGREAASLSNARKEQFLRTARVVKAGPAGAGVTSSWRLTLEDSELTHDAHFQSVDEHAAVKDLGGGRVELDFVDSYRYNVAAYRLAVLIGLDQMVPVSVKRNWRGEDGALTWWVDDVLMDEKTLNERGLTAPRGIAWTDQVYRVRLFNQLTYDTDRNQSNNLVTTEWKIWMIDFTRAFRRWPRLRSTEDLHRCDRKLYENLKSLTRGSLDAALGDVLTKGEIAALLARRDLLGEHFETLIAEHGEDVVLY